MAARYSASGLRHSSRAAVRFLLKFGLKERLRSELKWFWTDAWTAANICGLRIRWKSCVARDVLDGFEPVSEGTRTGPNVLFL